ncbi:MAG: SulP family inorganic anion transporter [Tagaea sp.]|nr:SulP family inorganic anion transporter [Tagaea sp.]
MRTPGFVDLYTPKLVTILREGYGLAQFRADAGAGLTVAIVALPLSMAIAIASGASPAQGLYTAVFGGFVVSALGGSRFQIGGPAGAFIVLVAATILQHGMAGTVLAVFLSGLMLIAAGLLRLGTYVKFIPYPVTVGFTAGIAVIIFASQIKDLLGLVLPGREPAPILEKLPVLWDAFPTFDAVTIALALLTIVAAETCRRVRPHWPGLLIAVALASLATAAFDLRVETIGSRFGGIPSTLPMPELPDFAWAKVLAVLPNALAFALLGAIESLLSAVVADGMTGRRHRSNCELVGQGFANLASALFGGISVTGTVARTATNVRAGAHGPIAGMLHAVFLLVFVLVAAPLASHIPLACLAGVLALIAWHMVEKRAFAMLLRASPGDACVLMATFLLTVFRDLIEAIVVGFALGSALFIHRMSKTTAVEAATPFVAEDRADGAAGARRPYDGRTANDPDVVVYRIVGAFFFGAAASIGSVLERIADTHRALVIDFETVPFVDATAAHTIEELARQAARRGVKLVLSGASPAVRRDLHAHGIAAPSVAYAATIDEALAGLRGP